MRCWMANCVWTVALKPTELHYEINPIHSFHILSFVHICYDSISSMMVLAIWNFYYSDLITVSRLQREKCSPTIYFQAAAETIVDALVDLPLALWKHKIILLRVILVVLFSWQPLNNPCLLIGPSHINDIRGQGVAIGHQISSDSFNNVYIMSQGCGKKFPHAISSLSETSPPIKTGQNSASSPLGAQ